MKILHVTLKDCYGIGLLDHKFDFDVHPGAGHDNIEHSQTNIVYARNGMMKTSFAKALFDYSERKTPHDGLHGRTPYIAIKADNTTLSPENLCVLRSNDEYFEAKDMALLLSNKKDQERYAEIMLNVETAMNELFDVIGKSMGIRGGASKVAELFDINFQHEGYNRLAKIISMEEGVKKVKPDFLRIDYKILSSSKVTTFLDKEKTRIMLDDYVDIYEKLLEQSNYFQDGVFDYSNAFKVQKSLSDNNFMKKEVGNKVIVVAKNKKETVIDSVERLRDEYDKDKNKVFDNLEKQIAYDKFDNEISANPDLRSLQLWVRRHKDLVIYLRDYKHTKVLAWHAHLKENEIFYEKLLFVYRTHKDELEELIVRSRSYESEWKSVVENFKASFRPKFDIQIKNKEDVVLKSVKPELVFIYQDDRGGAPKEVPVTVLNEHIFSTGERRALYILCMMFEIKVRTITARETVLVLDDIADSFDYKNKYAIIEYIYDLSVDPTNNIHLIILTHNYDFFRSIRMRCQMKYYTSPKVFLATRERGAITLRGDVHNDEFERLKRLSSRSLRAFLSLTPLARNFIEYKEGYDSDDYKLLTSVLHDKTNSRDLTVRQIITIIETNLRGTSLESHATDNPIQDKILAEADSTKEDGQENCLEDKIILALGVRIRAERHMKYVYESNGLILEDASGEQTGKWYAKFVTDYPSHSSISILKMVNIITPETLHINAFMYEPIIDMHIDELKELYNLTCSLSQ